jgi:hypoxanthine phosphoribosyltransferase
MNCEEARHILRHSEEIVSAAEVDASISRMAQAIRTEMEQPPEGALGTLGGGPAHTERPPRSLRSLPPEGALGTLGGGPAHTESEDLPLVLSVMGGAAVFTGMLLPRLDFPLEFDYIHLTRYRNTTRGSPDMHWRVAPAESVKDRVVLVLDDILDEGETMAAIRDRILAMGAKRFLCAVLCEKTLETSKPLHPDFCGFKVPNRYVFGCGMDAKGYWRNLPTIRALTEDA